MSGSKWWSKYCNYGIKESADSPQIIIFSYRLSLCTVKLSPLTFPHSHSHTFNTHVHAALPGDEVVTAPPAARVDELFAHLGDRVVVIPSYGGRALPFVHRVQAEHGNSCKINHKAAQ